VTYEAMVKIEISSNTNNRQLAQAE